MQQNDILPESIHSKPKNVSLAAIMSLLIPGLGQIYTGQIQKGIIMFLIFPSFSVVFGLTRAVTFFPGLLCLVLLELAFRIYSIVDAIKEARRKKIHAPKTYDKWYYHLSAAIAMAAILILIDTRSFLKMKSFTMPTGANEPTLKLGDYIMADMKAYAVKPPNYGDIVVAQSPDGYMYCYRVVGLPDDTIEIKNRNVVINGQPCKTRFVQTLTIDAGLDVLEYVEELPGGLKHGMYKHALYYDTSIANIAPIVIPDKHYYLMGDNRDNALDSRYRGTYSIDSLLGRVVFSYWGSSTDRIGIDFRNK